MSVVLVSGAAGFIANRLITLLLDQGFEVVGIDNMNDYYDVRLKQYRLNILSQRKKFKFLPIDIENREALHSLFNEYQFEVVYNLGARAGVRYSMENPHVYMTTNAHGSLNLLEEMRRKKLSKFILASTSSLYAGQAMPFLESLAVNTPISPYAASKKAAEVMAYTYHHLFGIDVSILRYFTVYGPAGRPDMSVLRFVKWIDCGDAVDIYGDGEQSRDFTYVDDIALGTALAAKPLGYEVINLGGGKNPITINQLIQVIENKVGKTAKVNRLPFHDADLKETWADIHKAESLLEWRPKVDIEQGIALTVDWYLQNRDFVKSLKL